MRSRKLHHVAARALAQLRQSLSVGIGVVHGRLHAGVARADQSVRANHAHQCLRGKAVGLVVVGDTPHREAGRKGARTCYSETGNCRRLAGDREPGTGFSGRWRPVPGRSPRHPLRSTTKAAGQSEKPQLLRTQGDGGTVLLQWFTEARPCVQVPPFELARTLPRPPAVLLGGHRAALHTPPPYAVSLRSKNARAFSKKSLSTTAWPKRATILVWKSPTFSQRSSHVGTSLPS